MSALTWTNDKNESVKRSTLTKRLVYGPALILAMALGSSAALAAALLLFSVVEI